MGVFCLFLEPESPLHASPVLANSPVFTVDAIIRVKPGRMRNFWFPKSLAEYMTRDRFRELGLTDAAIGVRDRTFGTHFVVDEETARARAKARQERRAARRPTTDKKATIDKIPEVPMLQVSSLFLPTASSHMQACK